MRYLLLLVFCGLAACSNSQTNVSDPVIIEPIEEPVTTSDRTENSSRSILLLWQSHPEMPFSDRELRGAVEITADCIYLKSNGQRRLAIFPSHATKFDAANRTLVFDGQTYQSGDDLMGRGVAISKEFHEGILGDQIVAPTCDTSNIFQVMTG